MNLLSEIKFTEGEMNVIFPPHGTGTPRLMSPYEVQQHTRTGYINLTEITKLLSVLDAQIDATTKLKVLGLPLDQITYELELTARNHIVSSIVGEYVRKSDRSNPKRQIFYEIESEVLNWLNRKRDRPFTSIEYNGGTSKEIRTCDEFVHWLIKLHNDLLIPSVDSDSI